MGTLGFPSVVRLRPPLSKKSFPVGRVGEKYASREVGKSKKKKIKNKKKKMKR